MKHNYIYDPENPLSDAEMYFLKQCENLAFRNGFNDRYYTAQDSYRINGQFIDTNEIKVKDVIKMEVPPGRLIFTYLISHRHRKGFLIEIITEDDTIVDST